VVESSTNLLQWTPVLTNVVNALGELEFTDSATTDRPASFYRVKEQ
jgi:hypothetical protein